MSTAGTNVVRTAKWLVRREFWENRAIWLIPAVFAGLLTLAALFGGYRVLGVPDITTLQAVLQAGALDGMLLIATIFFAVMSIYSTWYLLDCLYADRRDRSILFWKSMPVSDTATVLSKLGIALIVVPLVYFAFADLTTLVMAFIISVRAGFAVGGTLWHAGLWIQIQALWLYVIVTAAVWYLPLAGWLLLVSAWAKRAVLLWSILPPLALAVAERTIIGSHVIWNLFAMRLWGFLAHALQYTPGVAGWVTTAIGHDAITSPANLWQLFNPAGFFSSVQTWAGAAVGVALIAGAIQLRMRRVEI
jgi:ABC-2 type transport system permease protein